MWSPFVEKAGEKLVELSIAGLVAAVGWGIYTSAEVAKVRAAQSEDHTATVTNTGKINEMAAEQKLTNERLLSIREILSLMREDAKRSR